VYNETKMSQPDEASIPLDEAPLVVPTDEVEVAITKHVEIPSDEAPVAVPSDEAPAVVPLETTTDSAVSQEALTITPDSHQAETVDSGQDSIDKETIEAEDEADTDVVITGEIDDDSVEDAMEGPDIDESEQIQADEKVVEIQDTLEAINDDQIDLEADASEAIQADAPAEIVDPLSGGISSYEIIETTETIETIETPVAEDVEEAEPGVPKSTAETTLSETEEQEEVDTIQTVDDQKPGESVDAVKSLEVESKIVTESYEVVESDTDIVVDSVEDVESTEVSAAVEEVEEGTTKSDVDVEEDIVETSEEVMDVDEVVEASTEIVVEAEVEAADEVVVEEEMVVVEEVDTVEASPEPEVSDEKVDEPEEQVVEESTLEPSEEPVTEEDLVTDEQQGTEDQSIEEPVLEEEPTSDEEAAAEEERATEELATEEEPAIGEEQAIEDEAAMEEEPIAEQAEEEVPAVTTEEESETLVTEDVIEPSGEETVEAVSEEVLDEPIREETVEAAPVEDSEEEQELEPEIPQAYTGVSVDVDDESSEEEEIPVAPKKAVKRIKVDVPKKPKGQKKDPTPKKSTVPVPARSAAAPALPSTYQAPTSDSQKSRKKKRKADKVSPEDIPDKMFKPEAAARPMVTAFNENGEAAGQVTLPAVFKAPIRPDVVNFVHTNMAKNARQAYAVHKHAGHQTSAESWGVGRAVARIPRVRGGGTHRSGQGAFGNMCRGGRMFAPTKAWRRWHRPINQNQRRYAVCSALAASALPALVMARGHRVDSVNEVPCVSTDAIESITKTKAATELLQKIGAFDDVQKCKDSKKIRAGKGKMRNRRFRMRRGPLIVYNSDNGISQAFRNLPGVETISVDRLNLLKLAPGGHLGRFCIWSQSAFEKLDALYGTPRKAATEKSNYKMPAHKMTMPDLARLINSDEIQSVVRPAQPKSRRASIKKNPLKNRNVAYRLNPHAKAVKRSAILKAKTKI